MSMFSKRRLVAPLVALGLGIAAVGVHTAHATPPAPAAPAWADGWSAAPQRPSTGFEPNWSQDGFQNHTVRQVTRVSTGGSAVRIRLSNRFGASALQVDGATVAVSGTGASVRPDSLRRLTFRHSATVLIPAGAEITSDPVALRVDPLQSVTTSLYFSGATGPATFHSQAYSTTYRSSGNHLTDGGSGAFGQRTHSWYYLQDVQVSGGPRTGKAVVTFGDSITDGFGSTTDANHRYSDELANRFAANGTPRSVLDEGIGGNLLLHDSAWYGDTAMHRFQRDVLDKPQVGSVIVLLGTNDLGFSVTDTPTFKPNPDVPVVELIAGYRNLIAQAHAHGVRIVGATILPFKPSNHYDPAAEAKRAAINDWIRTSGEYDAVADFDRALADPADPQRLNPSYDSGDHLHPNDAGYRVLAQSVNLRDL